MSTTAHDNAPPQSEDRDTAIYVYGVTRGDTLEKTIVLPAEGVVPGVPVELLPAGDLAVLVSRAPKEAFASPESSDERDWATGRALAHHRVLASMALQCTVAPVKFGALCPGLTDILALVERQAGAFTRALEHVAGAQEWGVKLFADLAVNRSLAENADSVSALKSEVAAASPGKAYFLRKALETAVSDEMWSALNRLAESIQTRIAAISRDATSNPAYSLPGRSEGQALFLDAAYLVAEDRTAEFKRLLTDIGETCSAQDVELKLSGPWPPYNFTLIDTRGIADGSD